MIWWLAKIFFDMYLWFKVCYFALRVTENPHSTKRYTTQKKPTKHDVLCFGNKLNWVDYVCLLKLTTWKVTAKLKCRHQTNTMSLSSQGCCLWDDYFMVNICMWVCVCPISKSSLAENIESHRYMCTHTHANERYNDVVSRAGYRFYTWFWDIL